MVDLKDATRLGMWAVVFFDEKDPENPLGTALTPQLPPLDLIVSETNMVRRVGKDGKAIKMASTPKLWKVIERTAQWANEASLMNTAAVFLRRIDK